MTASNTRAARVPSGLRPLTRSERKRLTRENAKAMFPSRALQRYEATVKALENALQEKT